LLRLQLTRELLRLLEQSFGLHRRFDTVEHDADIGRKLVEESELHFGEFTERSELDHWLNPTFKQHQQRHDVPWHGLEQCRSDRNGVWGHLADQHSPFVRGALPDQALAEREMLGIAA